MKNRCLNPKSDRYPSYGGRGILIDPSWVNSFERFYADMGDCPDGLTLDRIDVNDGYGPTNCKWATMQEQSQNKTNTVLVEYEGETMSLSSAARKAGVDPKSLRYRVRVRGMDVSEAIAEIQTKVSDK